MLLVNQLKYILLSKFWAIYISNIVSCTFWRIQIVCNVNVLFSRRHYVDGWTFRRYVSQILSGSHIIKYYQCYGQKHGVNKNWIKNTINQEENQPLLTKFDRTPHGFLLYSEYSDRKAFTINSLSRYFLFPDNCTNCFKYCNGINRRRVRLVNNVKLCTYNPSIIESPVPRETRCTCPCNLLRPTSFFVNTSCWSSSASRGCTSATFLKRDIDAFNEIMRCQRSRFTWLALLNRTKRTDSSAAGLLDGWLTGRRKP